MIDWFRGEIDLIHRPLPAGRVLSVDSDGVLEWESVKRLDCRSSYETAIFLRSSGSVGNGMAASLMLDGNLAKFLQGHNVFGSRDLSRLLLLAFDEIVRLHPELFEGAGVELARRKIMKGEYLVKMLDINQLYEVGNDQSVEAWLHAAEMRATSRHGRAVRDKGTVYLGKTSRRWALKFYNKWRELKAALASRAKKNPHRLPECLQGLGLEEFIEGKLRAELRLMSLELKKHGLLYGHQFTPDLLQHLFDSYVGKMTMTQQATLFDSKLMELPRCVQSSYQLWRQGVNLQELLPRDTFYRHRKVLLEHGIDIRHTHLAPEHNNVVPLIRIIEAVPVGNPAWAYERGLIAA